MFRWLSRLLPWADVYADAKQAARLTESEAMAIADRAGGFGPPDNPSMDFSSLKQEGGEWIWVFTSPTVGRVTTIEIRDRDGKVVGNRSFGVR